MTPALKLRVTVTLCAILVALLFVGYLFRHYLSNPWTRDAEVRAHVLQIAPRIDGPIVALPIKDNQFVSKGDLLFKIDPRTFKAAVNKAKADLKEAEAKYSTAKRIWTIVWSRLCSALSMVLIGPSSGPRDLPIAGRLLLRETSRRV